MFYAFGSNGSGQLGVGHTNDLSEPQAILIEGNTVPWKIEQLAAGGNHTVLLCDDGAVRVTGNNEDGRCGLPSFNKLTHFTEIPLPVNSDTQKAVVITHVAATWASTLLLTEDGLIYVCGSGDHGELGLGPEVKNSPSLCQIPPFQPLDETPSKVIFVTAGMGHAIAILANSQVWGWGKGRKGQLNWNRENIWQPTRLLHLDFKIVQGACGSDFTLIFGPPDSGIPVGGQFDVLKHVEFDRFEINWAPSNFPGYQSIHASWGSAFVLNGFGEVKAWGRNDHGQLPLPGLPKIKALAAGSEHCLAIVEFNHVVMAWGWGEHGNCGRPIDEDGDVKDRYNVINVAGRATKVFAGCATSFIQTEEETMGDEINQTFHATVLLSAVND